MQSANNVRSIVSFESIPENKLGLIVMKGCKDLGTRVDQYLVKWRQEYAGAEQKNLPGYVKESFILDAETPRFGSGEAKGQINATVRGYDLYILVDVTNYSLTYTVSGHENHMSPDDHYQDLKRIISAVSGKAKRITVIMPFLYEGRQHKRSARESLDCACMLQELVTLGVDNIITFDAHDPRVQNAIPNSGFDSFRPIYQFVKGIFNNCDDLQLDADHLMIISPDEGATDRAVYLASVLGVNMGMFYKRRDYTQIVDGRNPIVAHEFLGDCVEGKDVFIIDDMISSGDSIIDVARQLKKRKANRIFMIATFGLFTSGMEKFDKAFEEGILYRLVTTNLAYKPQEFTDREYLINCDMSKFISYIVDTLNHDESMGDLMDPYAKIEAKVRCYNNR
jgi:ribose-phosphate pyrophosphokinase